MSEEIPVTVTDISCRFCGSPSHGVVLTTQGWQCIDIIDCAGRQPALPQRLDGSLATGQEGTPG